MALGYSDAMLTKDFWYDLPPDRIAQAPIRPRDHSKLMALDCGKQSIDHLHFYDLPFLLRPGDLLVWNDTKVFKARLKAIMHQTQPHNSPLPSLTKGGGDEKSFEVFLLRPHLPAEASAKAGGGNWLALVKPGRKLKVNDVLEFKENVKVTLIDKLEDGSVLLHFDLTPDQVFAFTDKHGQVPTPPYVKQASELSDYQTVYAQKTGSAAAPTAGFHFTPELIDKLETQGIKFASVTLHVGLGTFRPVTTDTLEEHVMHEEWIDVPQETMDMITQTKQRGDRVIAVGTTTVRALESCPSIRLGSASTPFPPTWGERSRIEGFSGITSLFLKPGDKFHVVDALITNFHLPESTLIVLVSAFAQSKMGELDAGRQFILKAYDEAIKNNYRFYSFGDAMFIQ